MDDDGYTVSATDRMRSTLAESYGSNTKMRTWALFAIASDMLSREEDTWLAVERAAEARREDAIDDALFGIMLVRMYARCNGQYDPFLLAARHLARSAHPGASIAERAAQSVFAAVMADATHLQPECSSRYKAFSDALWPKGDDDSADECPSKAAPEWFVLSHLSRQHRMSRGRWRSLCTNTLAASARTSAMGRFAYVYCSLVLAQDHHLVDRLSTFVGGDDTAESCVWRALEEIVLKTRSSEANPMGVVLHHSRASTRRTDNPFQCIANWWLPLIAGFVVLLVFVIVVDILVVRRPKK